MKQLIEKSIKFYGLGHPETITDFNVEKPSDKKTGMYEQLKTISGTKMSVFFDYTLSGNTLSAGTKTERVVKMDEATRKSYLASKPKAVKAATEEDDNVVVKIERPKPTVISKGSFAPKTFSGKLQLTIPKGLDNEGVKAFVLTQINTHLSNGK